MKGSHSKEFALIVGSKFQNIESERIICEYLDEHRKRLASLQSCSMIHVMQSSMHITP